MIAVTEATVPLNSACGPNDVCDDVNALCIGGLCQCRPLYYEESNVCSQWLFYIYLQCSCGNFL